MNNFIPSPSDAYSETEVIPLDKFINFGCEPHIEALYEYWDTGQWPDGFLPLDVVVNTDWLNGVMDTMNYIWAPEYGHPKRFMDELVDSQNRISRLLNETKLERVKGFRVLRRTDSVLDKWFHRVASWFLQFKYKPDGLLIFVNHTDMVDTITYISVMDEEE